MFSKIVELHWISRFFSQSLQGVVLPFHTETPSVVAVSFFEPEVAFQTFFHLGSYGTVHLLLLRQVSTYSGVCFMTFCS